MSQGPKDYRPDIDGLRALAVLSVVIFHAFPGRLPGGFIGVDVFFVISGYLISGIIFKEQNNRVFQIKQFYARRVRRIFPALALILLSCAAAGWFVLLAAEYTQIGKHISASAGFIQNLVLWSEKSYFDTSSDTKPLLHLWSLGIEEQFYLLWPVLLILLSGRRQLVWPTIITIVIASFAWNLWDTHHNPTAAFYSPLSRFWELLAGAALAWHTHQSKQAEVPSLLPIAYGNSFAMLGALSIASGLILIQQNSHFPGTWALLPVIGAVLIILAGPRAWLNRMILSHPVAIWFGLISYPLYLWHWPLLSFARILENETPSGSIRLLLVMLSVGLAWLTYQFLERPIRAHQSAHPNRSVFWLCSTTGLLAIFGGWVHLKQGLPERSVVQDSAQAAAFVSMDAPPVSDCNNLGAMPSVLPFCTQYAVANSKKAIVIWGDSTALSWSPVFLTIAKENSYSVIRIAHFSCPPILNARKTAFTYPASKHYCHDGSLQRDVFAFIRKIHPDLIVLMSAWSAYGSSEFITNQVNESATAITTERTLKTDLPETILALAQISDTLIFKSWPTLPQPPSPRVIPFLNIGATEVVAKRIDFNQARLLSESIFEAINRPNVRFYDPSKKICNDETCRSTLSGVHLYADHYHISPQGALSFKSDIMRLLKISSDRE